MSHLCHTCGEYFSKSFNLNRHKREVHCQKQTANVRILADGSTVLHHTFFLYRSRMYAKWQDCLGKNFVENAQKTISPTPQRISWCYGQWQLSYFDMMRTMPGIEFNEGIPEDIDETDYLDVSRRNLIIVLDDVMAQSATTNVWLIFLRAEVLTGICPSCSLCKIFFIKVRKCEILAYNKQVSMKKQVSMLARQVNP